MDRKYIAPEIIESVFEYYPKGYKEKAISKYEDFCKENKSEWDKQAKIELIEFDRYTDRISKEISNGGQKRHLDLLKHKATRELDRILIEEKYKKICICNMKNFFACKKYTMKEYIDILDENIEKMREEIVRIEKEKGYEQQRMFKEKEEKKQVIMRLQSEIMQKAYKERGFIGMIETNDATEKEYMDNEIQYAEKKKEIESEFDKVIKLKNKVLNRRMNDKKYLDTLS